jgi:hypothetical protein
VTRASYPLCALVEIRTAAVGVARAALAEKVATARQAEAARDEARAALASCRSRGVAPPVLAITADALQGRARFGERLQREEAALGSALAAKEAALADAELQVERRRTALDEARLALRVVESHRERWEAERRRARERVEQADADDRGPRRCR